MGDKFFIVYLQGWIENYAGAADSDSYNVCNAIPYPGKETIVIKESETQGAYFATALTNIYGGSGHTVTMDNWFTLVPLALSLRKSGMELVGTIRQNPYRPQHFLSFKMEVGESVAAYKDKITLRLNHTFDLRQDTAPTLRTPINSERRRSWSICPWNRNKTRLLCVSCQRQNPYMVCQHHAIQTDRDLFELPGVEVRSQN